MLLPALFEELEHCIPGSLLNNGRAKGVTIGETEETLFVELPIPGCQKEKIEVNYEKGQLLVKAQEEEAKNDVTYLLKSNRQYAYQVSIPRRIDEQSSPEATYKEGILKVEFKKSRSDRYSKIEVKTA